MENILSVSPALGLLSLIFLFVLSSVTIISVKCILRLLEEIKSLKELPRQPKPSPKHKDNGDLNVRSKDIKSITFKDDAA